MLSRSEGERGTVRGENGEIEENVIIANLLNRRTSPNTKKQVLENLESQYIGKEYADSIGSPIKIVSVKRRNDMTVEWDDGYRRSGIPFYKIKNGLVSRYPNWYAAAKRRSDYYLGKTYLSKNGMKIKVIDTAPGEKATVRFQNGETVQSDYFHIKHGLVVPPSVRDLNTTSFNEFTVAYYLKRLDFAKAPVGSLRKIIPGFGNKELDLYNEDYKIAVEYDGPLHAKKKERDKEKDILCQKAGITMIRIRESGAGIVHDGIAREIIMTDDHYFSPSLKNAINECIDKINSIVGKKVGEHIEEFNEKDTIRNLYAKRCHPSKHVGEVNISQDGELMTLVEYEDSTHCTIAFKNGFTTVRDYHAFKSGKIRCKYDHNGETQETKSGHTMTVIETINDGSKNSVRVRFENGAETVMPYGNFVKGAPVNCRHKICGQSYREIKARKKYVGMRVKCRNGRYATCETYEKGKCRIRFDDGIVVENVAAPHFAEGHVKYPKFK